MEVVFNKAQGLKNVWKKYILNNTLLILWVTIKQYVKYVKYDGRQLSTL